MSDSEKECAKNGDGMNRRQFFVKLGAGSVAVAGCGTALFAYQFLTPNVLYEPSPVVNAGKPERYESDSVTLDPANGIYVIHSPQGFYALSAVCTHLGCLTAWKQELGIIACPCHGSKFHPDGTKIEGPAPRPLPWLRMWVSDDGDLMVDRSQALSARQMVRV
ncbi:MAG TPA: ubiquinol-cytochrome c reductase iron-sulfur subunit [Terriglobales bacterium]|nr:ubiquinol-cytochrome c reductase iron-sulfur subunit [Terriglobales bacterium]